MKQQHWYHCSQNFHGELWIADRRAPNLKGVKEPPTPRLCVASSVARCFAARLFTGDVCVYRTESPRRSVTPFGVNDSILTQERWLVPPVPMVLQCVIQAAIVEKASGPTWQRLQRKLDAHPNASFSNMPAGPAHVERMMAFQEAIDALGDEFCDPVDRRFVASSLKYLQSVYGEVAA